MVQYEVATIPEFPIYEISNTGRVFNRNTGREMVLSPTIQGELTVGLVREGYQYRRSVKVMVAEIFVPGQTDAFDTPILLDGNKENLNADNLAWRPRWFAWKYSRQFTENQPSYFFMGPIFDIVNSIEYNSILEASVATGTLCEDIHYSLINETHVFPSGERFVFM